MWHNLNPPPYTRLNIAAAMQMAATISDTIIRKIEKLYNFSGFCVSKRTVTVVPICDAIGTCMQFWD